MIMKMISNTSMTSTSGVTLMSAIGVIAPSPELAAGAAGAGGGNDACHQTCSSSWRDRMVMNSPAKASSCWA